MDRVGAGDARDAEHLLDRQVALDRPQIAVEMRAAADLITFVRLEPVQRVFIFLGPDGDSFYSKFIGRAKHANSDFRTVGDENFLDGQGFYPGLAWRSDGIFSLNYCAAQTRLCTQGQPASANSRPKEARMPCGARRATKAATRA